MNQFEIARRKFRPRRIKTLFVAEAPPSLNSGRFFYFENVNRGDSLFLELMKVLYAREFLNARDARERKAEFLDRFKRDGCFLIDAVETPLPKHARSSLKKAAIRESLPTLKSKLRELCAPSTRIVLISSPVFAICQSPLKADGFNIINTEMIDFPASGRQPYFRQKLTRLLCLCTF